MILKGSVSILARDRFAVGTTESPGNDKTCGYNGAPENWVGRATLSDPAPGRQGDLKAEEHRPIAWVYHLDLPSTQAAIRNHNR